MQLCGDAERCYIFVVHKWDACYASFAALMANAAIKKIGVNVGSDVARVVKRFGISVCGPAELTEAVSHLNLVPKSLENMVSKVLGSYLDKALDHRCWDAPTLSMRQIEYAAADAWGHLRVWQRAPHLSADDLLADVGDAPRPALDPIDEECRAEVESDGEEESDGEAMSDGEDDDARGARAATYRHQPRRVAPGHRSRRSERAGAPSCDPAVMAHVDAAIGSTADDDDDGADDDAPPNLGDPDLGGEGGRASAATTALLAAKQQIEAYSASNRSSDLTMPPSFSSEQRKVLHNVAGTYNLYHRTVGIGGDQHLVISRARPLLSYTAAVGEEAVGATVAKDMPPPAPPRAATRPRRGGPAPAAQPSPQQASSLLRGTVASFDKNTMQWTLRYPDVSSELVGIDLLNVRLQRRHAADKVGNDGPPRIGPADEELQVRNRSLGHDSWHTEP